MPLLQYLDTLIHLSVEFAARSAERETLRLPARSGSFDAQKPLSVWTRLIRTLHDLHLSCTRVPV
jgi:hypothetical protein